MHTGDEPLPLPAADDSSAGELTLQLPDEAATLSLGAALAPVLAPGLVILLEGDLGAGKTTLVRGALRALGHAGKVKSPTYTLVELYVLSSLNLYHFDFYRLERPEEYLEAGLDEYFQGGGICLVEWPKKAHPYLAAADLRIRLALDEARGAESGAGGDSEAAAGRAVTVTARSARGEACLRALIRNWAARSGASS